MNPDDLLKLLDLAPQPPPPGKPVVGAKPPPADPAGPSPHVLLLDEWDVHQGAALHAADPSLPPEPWADFFGLAFLDDPAEVPRPADALRAAFVHSMLESADYPPLHHGTAGSVAASRIAATDFAAAYRKLLAKRAAKPGDKKSLDRDVFLAAGNALKAAGEAVDEYEGVVRGLGGDGAEKDQGMDPEGVREVWERVRNDPVLRRIFEDAGRFRRVAQTAQHRKPTHGYDDMVGITVDDDPAKLLPAELARLDDPELEWDALLRISSRQAMAREYVGYESEGRGPVVVVVDESGSMHGRPVERAKAFALGMAWVARHQRRWVVLIGYAGGSKGNWLVIPPGGREDMKLLDWLEHFYGGGSEMDVPLQELPNAYWPEFLRRGLPRGKSDVILVTDAIVHAPESLTLPFNAWKAEEKARCIGLVLNTDAGDLRYVCDEVHLMEEIGTESEGVKSCLTI